MRERKLDFICIGAAKSGTTTLHEVLKDHPELFLPKAKEVPFFNEPELMSKGYAWFYKQNFNKSKPNQKVGVVTPQYMYHRNGLTTKDIANNIRKHNKNIKLIVILRKPTERAFSHYKTAQRRLGVAMGFEEAAKKILFSKEHSFKDDDWSLDELAFYGSNYASLLEPYFKKFKRNQFLILYFDDLKHRPEKVVEQFLNFVGVDTNYQPEKLGEAFNKNGSKPKIPLLTPRYLHKPAIRKVWHVFPYRLRKLVEVKINSWNAKVDNEKINTTSKTYRKLVRYYSKEMKELSGITEANLPWKEFVSK